MLTIIERVMFLQNVDVFSEVSTERLALIAAITEELELAGGHRVYDEADISDAMYLVVSGSVRLHRGDAEITIACEKEAFGTWALFDDEPRVASATTQEHCHLLRLDKEDFVELLADNVEITQGVLKAIVRRLRSVLARVGPSAS